MLVISVPNSKSIDDAKQRIKVGETTLYLYRDPNRSKICIGIDSKEEISREVKSGEEWVSQKKGEK